MKNELNCFKNKSIYLLGVVPVALVLMLASFQQPVQANAYQDGQNQAEQDFMSSNGQDKNTSCSPEYGVDYCTGYKLGYEAKWAHMSLVFDCSSGECR